MDPEGIMEFDGVDKRVGRKKNSSEALVIVLSITSSSFHDV